jgi:hypothetical protein
VIPEGSVAVLSFVLFVAPGLFFEIRRERRRPVREASPFREISWVILASLAFTSLSLAILGAVRALRPGWIPDPGRWLRQGHGYLELHYRLVGMFLFAEVLLSVMLVLLVDSGLRKWNDALREAEPDALFVRASERLGRTKRRLQPELSGWALALWEYAPRQSGTFVRVELTGGAAYFGRLASFTPDLALQDREIVLGQPLGRGSRDQDPLPQLPRVWSWVVIPASEISAMWVGHREDRTPADDGSEEQAGASTP